jgi:hypothetical protein
MKLAMKLSPNVESWILDGKPVEGPLLPQDDPEIITDAAISTALRCKAWVLNENEFDSDAYQLRFSLDGAARWMEKPMTKKKILGHQPQRFRVWTPQDEKHFLPNHYLDRIIDAEEGLCAFPCGFRA